MRGDSNRVVQNLKKNIVYITVSRRQTDSNGQRQSRSTLYMPNAYSFEMIFILEKSRD